MIKKYLKKSVINEILEALKKVHNGKEIVWIDLDGVVADFEAKGEIEAKKK